MKLDSTQFQALSSCEAQQMARHLSKRIIEEAVASYKAGVNAALKEVNESMAKANNRLRFEMSDELCLRTTLAPRRS